MVIESGERKRQAYLLDQHRHEADDVEARRHRQACMQLQPGNRPDTAKQLKRRTDDIEEADAAADAAASVCVWRGLGGGAHVGPTARETM